MKYRDNRQKPRWTSAEEKQLKELVAAHGRNWDRIALRMGNHRTSEGYRKRIYLLAERGELILPPTEPGKVGVIRRKRPPALEALPTLSVQEVQKEADAPKTIVLNGEEYIRVADIPKIVPQPKSDGKRRLITLTNGMVIAADVEKLDGRLISRFSRATMVGSSPRCLSAALSTGGDPTDCQPMAGTFTINHRFIVMMLPVGDDWGLK